MSEKSQIEWTDATWNPVVGCTKISAGCAHCYAIRDAWRMGHNPNPKLQQTYGDLVQPQGSDLNWTGVVKCLPERLDWPYRWKRPRRIFVCSQSDLLHKDVPNDFILAIMAVIYRNPQHQFQILTKRAERLAQLGWMPVHCDHLTVGVSIESQETVWRLDYLKCLPTLHRFLSLEPLLGPLPDLYQYLDGIEWVIVGGESGPQARPMQEDWVREIRDQCQSMGVKFFYKQKIEGGKKVSLPLLDGRQWAEMPETKGETKDA